MNKILNKVDLQSLNKIYKSNGYGDFKIIDDLGIINKVHYVIIEFINTKFKNKVALNQVKYGSVRDKSIMRLNDNINPNILHDSNYGPFRIIKDAGRNDHNQRLVLIRFENTNNEKIYSLNDALHHNVKDEKYSNLDFNKEYESYDSGKFKILEYIGNKIYIIKFIETGSVLKVRKDHIIDGNIKDPALLKTVKIGDLYPSTKYGNMIVKEIVDNDHAIIEFIDTGYNKISRIDHIISGNVKDDTISSVYKVANYGNIDQDYKEIKKFYNIWNGMIARCYNQNHKAYKSYGKKGVTVCRRWLLFENFLNDIKYLPNYDKFLQYPNIYELDKDYLQQNIPIENRIYSPETCMFITKADNLQLALNENNRKIVVCKLVK